MSESIDSDSEFDRYMQDSFSSSIASSLSLSTSDNQFKKSNDISIPTATGGISTLGMSWLKSTNNQPTSSVKHRLDVNVPLLANETDEFLPQGLYDETSDEQEDEGGTRLSMPGRRRSSPSHRNSVTDDLLNFSQSSGFSIINEIDTHFGMRSGTKQPSPSRKPGEETLVEEEDKKRFFDELERGMDSTIDNGELNRQLSNTSLSMRGLTSANPLKTIDENDATPHISSDEEFTEDSHTHLPSVNGLININDPNSPGHHIATSSNTSLQSSSNRSLSLPSPLHSSSGHSLSKVLAKTPRKSPLRSASNDTLAPITEKLLEKRSKVEENNVKQTQNTTKSIAIENKSHITTSSSNSELLKPILQSTSFNGVHSNNKNVQPKPSADKLNAEKSKTRPLSIEPRSLLPFESTKSLPGKSARQVMTKSDVILPKAKTVAGERNLDELLRELATEELATLTHEIMRKDRGGSVNGEAGKEEDETEKEVSENEESDDDYSTERETEQSENIIDQDSLEKSGGQIIQPRVHVPLPVDIRPPYMSISRKPEHTLDPEIFSASHHDNANVLGRHDNLLTVGDSLALVKTELKNEKERVADLEDNIKEKERQEERIKLDYSQQIRELRTQLLDTKSKLRKLEDKEKHQLTTPTPGTPSDKEQERLIQGYQKENEKLYSELTQLRKQFQSVKAELTDENNKLGVELANLRVRATAQEESLCQFREQQSRYKTNNHDDIEQDRMDLQLYKEKCDSLQGQMEVLTVAMNKSNGEIQTKNKELMELKMEKEELHKKHNEKVSIQRNEMQQVYLDSENKLREKDEELIALRDIIKNTPDHRHHVHSANKTTSKTGPLPSNKEGGPYLVRSRTAADAKRIKELERQVQELYTSLKKRHPNSIPVLMYASSNGERGDSGGEMVKHFEKRMKELEKLLIEKETEGGKRLEELQERFHEMEVLYEEQIASLTAQLTEANRRRERRHSNERDGKNRDRKTADGEAKMENTKLKEKVSQLTLELAHQKIQLKGYIAEIENERRKTQEQWLDRMTHIEEDHKQKLDQLMVSLVKDRDDSDVVRLKSRLAAREAKIRTLEEEIDLVKTDGEILSVLKTREQELEKQMEIMKEELLEAKRYQTPEMHHYSSLLAKISHLETRQCEYQRRIEEMSSGHVAQEDLKKIERKYKKKLMEKNLQIEKFREELDVLMDTLYTLQKGNLVIKQ